MPKGGGGAFAFSPSPHGLAGGGEGEDPQLTMLPAPGGNLQLDRPKNGCLDKLIVASKEKTLINGENL